MRLAPTSNAMDYPTLHAIALHGAAPSGVREVASPAAENIQVQVRVRPLNEFERNRGDHECVHVSEDGRTVQRVAPLAQADRMRSAALNAKANIKALTFDGALCGSSQARVFESARVEQLLRDALAGFAVTVFAYGQTGSGKTFTMSGPESLDLGEDGAPAPLESSAAGLMPRALGQLFSLLGSRQDGRLPAGCSVRASYLELYNESINDLLNPDSTNLQLRWQVKTGAFVENLLQVDCESVIDAMAVFNEGTRNRKVGSHLLNKDSSRSHCMMSLYVQRADLGGPEGRISFVDLAGSERLSESHTAGDALKETGHINKSLFALGNVISALADARRRGGYIPYRDSKLTRLLMDGLGGEGRTLMLACCSPSSHHLDETLNTLHFASRSKNIQNRPVVQQVDTSGTLVQQMQAAMRSLHEENAALRSRLESPLSESPRRSAAPSCALGAGCVAAVPSPSTKQGLELTALRQASWGHTPRIRSLSEPLTPSPPRSHPFRVKRRSWPRCGRRTVSLRRQTISSSDRKRL